MSMNTDVDWNAVDAENARTGMIPAMPPVSLHAETLLRHLEHSLAFARMHLTQAESEFQTFRRMIQAG